MNETIIPVEQPGIEIIIPNWNGARLLRCCLDSLREQSYRNFSVTVVDNGSTDTSRGMLAKDYPLVRVLSFSENRGFSVAVNAGLRKARHPWILLLNNDMEVDPDCLARLVEGIDRYPACDFFALKMYNYYQRTFLDGAGDAVLRGGVGYRLGTMESDSARYCSDYPCFGACAGAALYHRRFFENTGYFDEDFFAYLEDVDLNFRASLVKMTCMFLCEAKVYHMGSATTGSKFNDFTIRFSTRNTINLLVKNYPTLLLLRFFPAILVYQFFWFLFCAKKKLLRPWWQGVREALTFSSFSHFYEKHRLTLAAKSWREIWQQGNRIVAAEGEAVRSIMARRQERGKNNFLFRLYLYLFC